MWHFPADPRGRTPKFIEVSAVLKPGGEDQLDALVPVAVVLNAYVVEVGSLVESPQSDELAHDTLFRLLASGRCRP